MLTLQAPDWNLPALAQPAATFAPSNSVRVPADELPSLRLSPSVRSPVWSVPVLHTMALFAGMRATEAYLWPQPFAETRPRVWLEHYERAFTRPPLFDTREAAFEWDHDAWTINVVGHGLLGSELYYRPRRCGASPLASLAFAAGASALWEYGFEGNGVRPSALDLAYTPLVGLLLGEARFLGWRAARSIDDRSVRWLVQTVLDPFGQVERGLGAAC